MGDRDRRRSSQIRRSQFPTALPQGAVRIGSRGGRRYLPGKTGCLDTASLTSSFAICTLHTGQAACAAEEYSGTHTKQRLGSEREMQEILPPLHHTDFICYVFIKVTKKVYILSIKLYDLPYKNTTTQLVTFVFPVRIAYKHIIYLCLIERQACSTVQLWAF